MVEIRSAGRQDNNAERDLGIAARWRQLQRFGVRRETDEREMAVDPPRHRCVWLERVDQVHGREVGVQMVTTTVASRHAVCGRGQGFVRGARGDKSV
jgi:hypothetical protein